jgi:hypothetical protein
MGSTVAPFLTDVVAWLATLAMLAATGSLGVSLLKRATPFLHPLEQLAYGPPLGVVAASLATLPLASAFGFGPLLVFAVGLASAIGAFLVWPDRPSATTLVATHPRALVDRVGRLLASAAGVARSHWSVLPVLVIGAFVLRWAVLWSGALTYTAEGLWAGHVNIWGDWTLHLGDTSSFAYGDNFPPRQPRLVGHAYGYHYLASLTAAMMVALGLDASTALPLHSFLFSVLIALGLFAFARRLTADSAAAVLTLALLLLGGGLGWLLTVLEMADSRDVLGMLVSQPWDDRAQRAANFQLPNVYFTYLLPQRGYLYGLPLALLILTLLLRAGSTGQRRLFLMAGLVAGLLPLAHLSTLLALALITPFLFLSFLSRRWLLFFGVWVAVAVPQLYYQQGGERGALSALRLQIGWIAGADPWPWFWLKNLGLFLPLLGLALAARTLIPPPGRRLLWAFMPIFPIGNLVVFQPWDWDNTKVFLYWFLATCILVAALLVRWWRRCRPSVEVGLLASARAAVAQGLIAGVVLIMLLPGLMANVHQLLGRDRHRLLTAEELHLAAAVRAQTPPRAVFAVGLQHNHPIPLLSGRPVVMSYPGWLWSQGFDSTQRERDLRAIFRHTADAPALLAAYGVDYVVVGPFERERLSADLAAYRERYRRVIGSANYEVFAIREMAEP